MRLLDGRAPSNDSSGDDAVGNHTFNYGDCFPVRSNTTSATTCVNTTTFGADRFLDAADYYYYGDDAGWDFFDIYYSSTRFSVETTMAVLSMTLNVLDALSRSRQVQTTIPGLR